MKNKSKIFVSCEESNSICDKSQYKEASLWERFKLNLHLLYCSYCRNYTKHNRKLTSIIKNSGISYLEKDKKAAMKSAFDEALKEHQQH